MKLTETEAWVLGELASGQFEKEIAACRGVTVTAISKIARHAREKLGARSTCQAVLFYALDSAKNGYKPGG